MPLLVGTRDGLHTFESDGTRDTIEHRGRSVTSLGRAGEGVVAILDSRELWRRPDGTWDRVTALAEPRPTCVTAIGGEVFVGTEGARLFRLVGDGFEPVVAFDRVEGRDAWYTPWGGPPATRSAANWDDIVYVNVHVGGIVRSDDAGRDRWAPTIDIDADIHHVTTWETSVLGACARGLAVSGDAGATWTYRTDGLEAKYARAVAVCGDVVLVSASNGPRGGRAGVYRADLGGGEFERCRIGLPEWFDDNIDTYCLDAEPDGSLVAFGTLDGRAFTSTDQGSTWNEIVTGLARVQRVLVMPQALGSAQITSK